MEPINKVALEYQELIDAVVLESGKQIFAVEKDIAQVNELLKEAISVLTFHFMQVYPTGDRIEEPKGQLTEGDAQTLTQKQTAYQHASSAIAALQFEDLTRQLNNRSAARLAGLRVALEVLANTGATSPNIVSHRFKNICDELNSRTTQSIHQTHLKCGDVELF